MSIWTRIKGGWKTYGPNAIAGAGGFDSGSDPTYSAVTADQAIKLSAVSACLNLRSETIGSLPVHLRDSKKNVITDHPTYDVIHNSPNALMTAPEYWSLCTAHVDLHGNAISIVERRNDGSVISLEPMDPTKCYAAQKKSGRWVYNCDGNDIPAENILHLKGFSLDGGWGLSRLEIGNNILSSQLTANDSATRAFKQGLKVGGFFEVAQNLDKPQQVEFKKILDNYGLPENEGKWMTLLKGMKPIGGAEFRIKPAEAELLASRYYGIEEICRLMCVPPQLIGHTDKASSWASSLEQINLFFLMYSVMPTIVRKESRISKTLLSVSDRAKGIVPKFNIQGLLRSDMKTQALVFASALQNGYYNRNEVRDLLERGEVEGGDTYTVQLNMADAAALGASPAPAPKP